RFEGGRQQRLFFWTHGTLLVVVQARQPVLQERNGRTPNVRGCGRSRAPSAFASCERHAHPGPPPPGAYLRLVPPESADGLPTLRGTVSASRGSPRTMAGPILAPMGDLPARPHPQVGGLWRRWTSLLDVGVDGVPEGVGRRAPKRSEEHTSELQSRFDLVC